VIPDGLYDVVAGELDKGDIRQGLWAKAFADADGDEAKTKARYINMRVEQLAATDAIVVSVDELQAVPTPQTDVSHTDESCFTQTQQNEPIERPTVIESQGRGFLTIIADSLPIMGALLVPAIGIFAAIAIPQYAAYKAGNADPSIAAISSVPDWISTLGWGLAVAAVALLFAFQPKSSVGRPLEAWRRLFAKTIDFGVGAVLAVGYVVLTSPSNIQNALLVFWAGIFVAWAGIEMVCITSGYRTLGRYLLGITVVMIPSAKPSTFGRMLGVSIFGLGLGIPIVGALTSCVAYKRYRETGTTAWDKGRYLVSYSKLSVGKLLISLLVFIFLQSLLVAISNHIGRSYSVQRVQKHDVPEVNRNHKNLNESEQATTANKNNENVASSERSQQPSPSSRKARVGNSRVMPGHEGLTVAAIRADWGDLAKGYSDSQLVNMIAEEAGTTLAAMAETLGYLPPLTEQQESDRSELVGNWKCKYNVSGRVLIWRLRDDGKVLWQTGDDKPITSWPTEWLLTAENTILFFNKKKIGNTTETTTTSNRYTNLGKLSFDLVSDSNFVTGNCRRCMPFECN
jgi:cell division protein FtsL